MSYFELTDRTVLHINKAHLNNFAFGFDYYQMHDSYIHRKEADVLIVSLLFLNLTFTRWTKWI